MKKILLTVLNRLFPQKKSTSCLMKMAGFIILSLVLVQGVLAQKSLSRTCNALRAGDILYKVKIPYVNAGEAGTDKIWTLGSPSEHHKDFLQGIVSKGDTITVLEKGNICHYIMSGDTLFDKGEQQRRTYRLYDVTRPLICYPFNYGDSISGNYEGKGRDENFDVTIQGWGYTVADGQGILTDGEDTLYHVTRLRMSDEHVENYGDGMEIHVKRDRHLWFCAGYRYPVMESCKWMDSNGTPTDSITYLLLPSLQYGLGEDEANDSVLNQLDIATIFDNTQENSISKLSSIQANLLMDGMSLTIDYTLDADADITFVACDMVGNILASSHYTDKTAGNWQEHMVLARKPVGGVLLLNVQSEEEKMSIKVFQKY